MIIITALGLLAATLGAYAHSRLDGIRAIEDAESKRRVLAEIRRIELHEPERIIRG